MDTDLLTERLHHLSEAAPLPETPPSEDVRRGRGRLRRRRWATGSGVAVMAVVAGVAWAGAGDDVEPPPSDRARVATPAPAADGVLARVGLDLSARADADGDGVVAVEEMMALATSPDSGDARTRAGMVFRFDTGTEWDQIVATCPSGWTCGPATLNGADRSMLAVSDDFTQVVAEYDGEVIMLTFVNDRSLLDRDTLDRAELAYDLAD